MLRAMAVECHRVCTCRAYLMGPRPRPSRICVRKGGFFGSTPCLRGKPPLSLLLECCRKGGSRVRPIGGMLWSWEGARALFTVKSSYCRIFGSYPEKAESSDCDTDRFTYAMYTCAYGGGLYTRVSSAPHGCARARDFVR